jgi:glycosyltransferase involved in cell wall biosynthesis
MKNILVIANCLPVDEYGGDIRIFNAIKGLSKDNKITLLSLRKKNQAEDLSKLKEFCEVIIAPSFVGEFLKESFFTFIKVIFVKIFFQFLEWLNLAPNLITTHRAQVYFLKRQLRKLLVLHDFDIIEVEQSYLGNVLKNLKTNSVKIIDFIDVNYEKPKNIVSKKLLFLYEKNLAKIYDSALVCSEIEKDRIKNFGFKNIIIVPNGVDTKYFNLSDKNNRKRSLVFVGDLTYYPNKEGIEYFLKNVYPILPGDINIDIIGKYNKKDFQQEKKYKNVVFHGFKEDIRDYLQGSIFFCPIVSGGGTRLKILTAFASGCPVISTSKGAEGIKYSEDKDIFIADTPEIFKEKVEIFLNNPEIYNKISKNSRKTSLSYDWDIILNKYCQDLNALF